MGSGVRPWIAQISDVLGSSEVATSLPPENGFVRYVRAVPEPFCDGVIARAMAGWKVFRGEAVAFKWPTAKEVDDALKR